MHWRESHSLEIPEPGIRSAPLPRGPRHLVRLQLLSLCWLLVECAVAIKAAVAAHSPVLLAFGSDSLVELLSATLVLLQWRRLAHVSKANAARLAAVLLFTLAVVVAALAALGLLFRQRPDVSPAGIAVTAAALVIMPVLAGIKRQEARRSGNVALAADAVQSATCAYLAAITLAGLVLNAAFHIDWLDPAAALIAVPLLLKEARSAWQGRTCACG